MHQILLHRHANSKTVFEEVYEKVFKTYHHLSRHRSFVREGKKHYVHMQRQSVVND